MLFIIFVENTYFIVIAFNNIFFLDVFYAALNYVPTKEQAFNFLDIYMNRDTLVQKSSP